MQFLVALFGQVKQGAEFGTVERTVFCGALNLDEGAGTGHGHVHVGHGLTVFNVWQVKHRGAVDHAHRYGGHIVLKHAAGGLDMAVLLRPIDCVDQSHVRTGYGSRASAAIGLKHIAVKLNLILAERLHIDDATQAAANQSADFVGTATDFATYGFTVGAFGGGTRQHRVFGGDPAEAGVLAPTRHTGSKSGGAHHARVTAFDEHGAFGGVGKVAGDAHRAQFVDLAAVGTNYLVIAKHVFDFNHAPQHTPSALCLDSNSSTIIELHRAALIRHRCPPRYHH